MLNKEISKCKVAAIQMVSTDSVDANLATMSAQVRLAASKGAELVVLPNTSRLLGSQRLRKLNGLKWMIVSQVLMRMSKKSKLFLVTLQRKIVFG